MATTATPTLVAGVSNVGNEMYMGVFTLLFDTTDANGELSIDLTDYFKYVYSVEIGGSLATTGYVCEIEKPAAATAITSTNIKVGVYEAGADGAPLDPVASTDVSAVVTGLTIVVIGRQAI